MAEMYTPDSRLMPALVALKDCLCSELTKRGLSAGCTCSLVHGNVENVEFPEVGKGVAYVGIGGIFESTAFPNPAAGASPCGRPLAASITMGVLRCYRVGTSYPSADDSMLYLDKQMADMAAMKTALTCCSKSSGVQFEVSLGTYAPFGPEGGVYGGIWTATVGQVDG